MFLSTGWGSHSAAMSETPYLTAAASIGMTHEDIALLIKRLDKVLAEKMKKSNKASAQETGRKTPIPEVGHKTPTHELVGRKTPTPKIGQLVDNPGRKTPTHHHSEIEVHGRKTPIQVYDGQGRKTPTQVLNNNFEGKKLGQGSSANMQSTDV